jgi:hypothetical protein
MLSSIYAIRRCNFVFVKFLSRLFTASNLPPSIHMIAFAVFDRTAKEIGVGSKH